MTLRYWKAYDPPEALLDWVSENVAEAARIFWESEDPDYEHPVAWIEDDLVETDGRLILTIGGPGKPTADDESGMSDCYTFQVDLTEELELWARPYADRGGPCSEEQRDDIRARAALLAALSAKLAALAAEALETANAELRSDAPQAQRPV